MESKKKPSPNVANYKKAPQAPRRFKSSYMFFSIQKHKQIRIEMNKRGESNNKICTTTVAKMVSQAWKNLSCDERAVFEEMARKDKERYEREKSRYTGPWKVLDEKLRKKKDPDAPKKPMSAFLAFSNSKRAQVKREHGGDTDNAKLSQILAQMWKDASEEQKKVYIDKEFKLRQDYKIAMEEWKKENQESEINHESFATGERSNSSKISSAHSEYHHHGNSYGRDTLYFDPISSSANTEEERGVLYGGSGYYPYYHYQNGHLQQLHPPGAYPPVPSSYGETSQYRPHPPSPLPHQQQSSSTTMVEGYTASRPADSYYLHSNGGSLKVPPPISTDTTSQDHHYYQGHQYQTSYSTYHKKSAPTTLDPGEEHATGSAPPHGYNKPSRSNSNYHFTSDYCHRKTDYTSADVAYGGNSYQQYPPAAPHYSYCDSHQQHEYQYNGNSTDVQHDSSQTMSTLNYDYYAKGGENNAYQHQGSKAYHYQEAGPGPARDLQQQGDGSHLHIFGGASSLSDGDEY